MRKSDTFKNLLLLLFLIMQNNLLAQAYNKYEAKLGFGVYQGYNIGFNHYYNENRNVGVGFGSYFNTPPFDDERHLNILLEHNFHFGAKSKQNIRSWIFNQQLMYWTQGAAKNRWRIMSLGLNIGRVFTITKHLGLGFEMGPAFNLVVDVKREPHTDPAGWMWPVLYNGRGQIIFLF